MSHHKTNRSGLFLLAVAIAMSSRTAHATLKISAKPSQNVTCSGGVCEPTAANAVLNVDELQALLASGDATVTTTGSAEANDIVVSAPLSWTGSALTLDANHQVAIEQPVFAGALAGLTILADDSDARISFRGNGNVTFADVASEFSINGVPYTLADTLPSLASLVAANPGGDYALARSYDAGADGTYPAAPIATLSGRLEGLGNAISNLAIDDPVNFIVGLIATIEGEVRDLGVLDVSIVSVQGAAGALAGLLDAGVVFGCHSSGTVSSMEDAGGLIGFAADHRIAHSHSSASASGNDSVGGLAGVSYGQATIDNCYATGAVTGGDTSWVGGLIGQNLAFVRSSFATGPVTTGNSSTRSAPHGSAGGLVGYNFRGAFGAPGTILDSYARGAVAGGHKTFVGGLIGLNYVGPGTTSYSTGTVTVESQGIAGGFVGGARHNRYTSDYWDKDTSGKNFGTGNVNPFGGITGLSTAAFQAALPAGFDPTVWAQDPSVNGGYPYLIENPPPE